MVTRKPNDAVQTKNPTRRRFIDGTVNINTLLAFLFGVVFVTALLTFSVLIDNPSGLAQQIFIVVLALAAAGVAAVIPGLLHVQLPFARAGGALAVFAIVFWQKPAIVENVAKIVPPSISPTPAIHAYLAKVDAGDIAGGYQLLDEEAKGLVVQDLEQMKRIYRTSLGPLGPVVGREESGSVGTESPPGFPIGAYRGVTFRTQYGNGKCYQELVNVRATNDLAWRVFSHQVSPIPIPCPPTSLSNDSKPQATLKINEPS